MIHPLRRLDLLDRRVTDPRAKEQHRHPEAREADALQVQQQSLFRAPRARRDDRSQVQRPEVGLQMLASRKASVLPGRDRHPAREHRGGRGSPLGLHFLNERAEGRQPALTPHAHRRALPAELYLVERPLPQTTAPAVQGREVRPRRRRLGISHRRAQPATSAHVGADKEIDHRQRIRLVGQQIRGEHPRSRTAGPAPRQGNRERHRAPEQHRASANQGRGQLQPSFPAPRAADPAEPRRHLPAARAEVLDEFLQLQGY